MANIQFNETEQRVQLFLKREIEKRGNHGGVKSIAAELKTGATSISKVLRSLQKPSKNLIESLTKNLGFDPTLSIENSNQETTPSKDSYFRIGTELNLSAAPIFLALKKSEKLERVFQVAHNFKDNSSELNLMFSNELSEGKSHHKEFYKKNLNSITLQEHLNTNLLDAIIIPENAIDKNFNDILPVVKIGNADMVISVIGDFDAPELEKKSFSEYLNKKDFDSFLQNKTIKMVFLQNKIAEVKFKMLIERWNVQKIEDKGNNNNRQSYSAIDGFDKNFNRSESETITEALNLKENEVLMVVGTAPCPVMFHISLRDKNERFKHLAFNMSDVLELNSKTQFVLCTHKNIFSENQIEKLQNFMNLLDEMKFAIRDILEYQILYQKQISEPQDVVSVLLANPARYSNYINSDTFEDFKKAINQNYIFELNEIFYPKIFNFEENESKKLFQRALIKHFDYDSTDTYVHTFVIAILKKHLSSNRQLNMANS